MSNILKQARWDYIGAPLLACTIFGETRRATAQVSPLRSGIEKLCSIRFEKGPRYLARVEDSDLMCLQQAARSLKDNLEAGPCRNGGYREGQ